MNRFALLMAVAAIPMFGAEIVLPSISLERDGTVNAIYKTGSLATGKGVLSVKWTDSYGRILADDKIPIQMTDEDEIVFPLPVFRAVAMKNTIEAHFSFEGVNRKGLRDHREEDARVDFIAKPPDRKWRDYAIIMWQHRTTAQFAALKQAGINGGESVGRTEVIPDFLLDNNLRWYAENISTDFYSAYHRWFPDRRVNWRFTEARELYKKDRTNMEPLKRHPSLSDPVWLQRIHDRLVKSAEFYSPYRPFFYSLGDESGIADLAAFWDFDYSDQSLEAMREWLKARYGTLEALNAQWGTSFGNWDSVIPETTDRAMKRQDGNFSSWSDFKEWMDIAYAKALKMGTDAVHSVDPDAYVGIGGGQMPGWGGYDYSRIVKSLTAIEPYDIGNNIEIIRSLNPEMAVLTTSFATGPWEKHRVWYEMLHGSRGSIIWDDKSAFVNDDSTLGPRAREVAPYYTELRNGIAEQLINSRRVSGPVAIHYSQPSLRIEWMLAQQPNGENWVLRNSSTEATSSNNFLRLRESYCRLIEDEGLQYNFVSYGQVADGALIDGGYKVLILPHSSALSAAEAQEIRDFVARGGTVIADGQPGVYDEHDRKLEKSQLADLFDTSSSVPYTTKAYGSGKAIYLNTEILNYHQFRLENKEAAIHDLFGGILRDAGVRPEIAVTGADGKPVVGIEVHTFRNGGATILALMTNPQLRVNELGPPEFRSNERFAKEFTVQIKLPGKEYAYDLRAGKPLGEKREMTITVQPYEPRIISLSPVPFPEMEISVVGRIRRGGDLRIGIHMAGNSSALTHAIHLDVLDPAAKIVDYYSGNLLTTAGRASKLVPLADNDATGRWQARVHDLLSGQEKTADFEVY